jgi:hypothetical protein
VIDLTPLDRRMLGLVARGYLCANHEGNAYLCLHCGSGHPKKDFKSDMDAYARFPHWIHCPVTWARGIVGESQS